MSASGAGPVVTKRNYKSKAGADKVKRPCKHCAQKISCSVLPSGTINEGTLRTHEIICKMNPNRVVKTTVRGSKVGVVFGPLGSDAEFQAPDYVLKLTQGSSKALKGAIHRLPDGSEHPVVGMMSGKPIKAAIFFGKDVRCCYDAEKSMLKFRNRPELFPNMYNSEGKCLIAQISTEKVEGAPQDAPWTISTLRKFALNCHDSIEVYCIGCKTIIEMCNNSCAQGQGPCRNCTGKQPDMVLYGRSLQAYFDATGKKWTTVPDAFTILSHHYSTVQMTCTVCTATWPRVPASQVQNNSGCPGCEARHRGELCAYELYQFVFPEADMYLRGQARLEGVHKNPFDVASTNIKVVVEVMSYTYHVEEGRLPNDMEKMLAALRAGYVYIMAHSKDYEVTPARFLAWKRCIVAALRLAKEDATPRMIHVRRDATWSAYDNRNWSAYDCMCDAALAAEFPYEDVFCGDVNAHAAERLPGETHTQTTLPV